MENNNQILSLLRRLESERGQHYRFTYGVGMAEMELQLYKEFIGTLGDLTSTAPISALSRKTQLSLVGRVCKELKKITADHLTYKDEKDNFFTTRGHNVRRIIMAMDIFLRDRDKLHEYLEGSLSHQFLIRMEKHVASYTK